MTELTKICKICKICKIEKESNYFRKQRRECKTCENEKYRVNKNLEGLKKCNKCDIEKTIQKFRPGRKICYDCTNQDRKIYMKEYYDKNKKEWKDKERERNKLKIEKQNQTDKKTCSDCSASKFIIDFRLNRNKCKDCERKNNRETKKIKMKNDPFYRMISNCRVRLIQVLGLENKKKDTLFYLGENIEIIKSWFEFCFDDNINWITKNKWHIDHVIPVSKFEFKDENDIIKCFNWKNLSPLSIKENLTKSNNILTTQINQHISRLRLFAIKIKPELYNEIEEYIHNIFLPYLTI